MRDLKNDARQLFLIAEALKASGMSGPTLARKVRAAIPRLPKEVREHFERAFGALAEEQMGNEQLVEFFRKLARWMESGMKNEGEANDR